MPKKKPKTERSDVDRRIRQCERLARLMKLLHLISGRGRWDAAALAEELECSKRTVHRFLQTLSMAGVPWHFDKSIRAYRVRPGYKFPLLELDSRQREEEQHIPAEISEAMENLLENGEAFAASLNKFLDVVRQIKSQ